MRGSPQLRGADIHPSTPSGLSPVRSMEVALGPAHRRTTSRLRHKDPNPGNAVHPNHLPFPALEEKVVAFHAPQQGEIGHLKIDLDFYSRDLISLPLSPSTLWSLFLHHALRRRAREKRREKKKSKKGSCLFTSQWKDLSCYYLALQFCIIWRGLPAAGWHGDTLPPWPAVRTAAPCSLLTSCVEVCIFPLVLTFGCTEETKPPAVNKACSLPLLF